MHLDQQQWQEAFAGEECAADQQAGRRHRRQTAREPQEAGRHQDRQTGEEHHQTHQGDDQALPTEQLAGQLKQRSTGGGREGRPDRHRIGPFRGAVPLPLQPGQRPDSGDGHRDQERHDPKEDPLPAEAGGDPSRDRRAEESWQHPAQRQQAHQPGTFLLAIRLCDDHHERQVGGTATDPLHEPGDQ